MHWTGAPPVSGTALVPAVTVVHEAGTNDLCMEFKGGCNTTAHYSCQVLMLFFFFERDKIFKNK